ncbi:MAG: LysM peptidoglycan-binding domain-containing protein [Bacteroidia bacterium]|nr:LysM peptidoglycan-binding domain-containing protein [Bacteroidia bacterium]
MKRIGAVFFCVLIFLTGRATPDQNDQLYEQRLASLKSPIELSYNEAVRKQIDLYLADPEKTGEILGRSLEHFQTIEKLLREKQLPVELKYLVVAATGVDNALISPAGATGYWRMMYNVARTYGLKINSFVDERKDLTKSTIAAASYLRDLNNIYNNWLLSLAAYANTPAILNKAIRQSGYKMNFWDVYALLPAENKEMIPQFIASAYIFNFYKEHNIAIGKSAQPVINDTVTVNKWLSFQQISSTLDIEMEELRGLNPIFKKDIIPLGTPNYIINLPKGKAKHWNKLRDSVYIYVPKPSDMSPVTIQKTEPKPEETPPATTEQQGETTPKKEVETAEPAKAPKEEPARVFDKKRVMYTVKSGDVLGNIADWFDVTPQQIKSWNKLKSNNVRIGQKLIIWVPGKKFAQYNKINGMTKAQKNALRKKD